MNKYKDKSTRDLIEMIIDQVQDTYKVVSGMPQQLDSLETKVDYLADKQNEMFMELKAHNRQLNNHELRITKLETA